MRPWVRVVAAVLLLIVGLLIGAGGYRWYQVTQERKSRSSATVTTGTLSAAERTTTASQTIVQSRASRDEATRKAGETAREEVLAASADAVLDDIAQAILELRRGSN